MRKSAKNCSKRQVARLPSSKEQPRWTTVDDMAWTTPRNDTFSCRLSDCLFHNFHSSLQHQFSMFHRFFMRRRDRLTEPLVFSHLLEDFSSGLFSQVLPFEISAWVRRVRCRSLARSLPPLKAKNPAEETSGVFWTSIGRNMCTTKRVAICS